ncbi:MAG: ribosome silencing factor [Gammaproteobacteria bacterium]
MELKKLHNLIIEALEDMKSNDLVSVDMRGKIDIIDMMVIASGTSDRHVQALADNVVEKAKKAGATVVGVEKDRAWVLIDLYDIIVHVMLPETRDFYDLEKLWQLEIPAEKTQTI